jgi:hypothetical protein
MKKQANSKYPVADAMLTGTGVGIVSGLAAGIALRRAFKNHISPTSAYGIFPVVGGQVGLIAGRKIGEHNEEKAHRDAAREALNQVQEVRRNLGV